MLMPEFDVVSHCLPLSLDSASMLMSAVPRVLCALLNGPEIDGSGAGFCFRLGKGKVNLEERPMATSVLPFLVPNGHGKS